MHSRQIHKILQISSKSHQLLKSGQFGQGLWPVDPELGQLMYWLIRSKNLKKGIEVGAGVGYSTFWIAQALQENDGKLTTFEYFPPKIAQLEKHLTHYFGKNYEEFISLVPADLTRAVKHLGPQKFDFVFFDQRKSDYLSHLLLLLPKLKKGAYICADNVSSHKKAAQEYLNFVKEDQRFESIVLESGAGMSITRFVS